MVVFIVNGWAHRMLNNGLIESAPVRKFGLPTDEEKEIIVPADKWQVRTAQEMNLTGGDQSLIAEELHRFSHVFADESYKLPSSQPLVESVPLATAPR